MISPKIELPSLPRSGPARTGRQDGDVRKAPAFDDALREQGEPATAAPDDATREAADAPDSAVAVSPTVLDVLIAQMLPYQQAPTPLAGELAPSPVSDQLAPQGAKAIAPQASPDTRGKTLPLGVQPDVDSISDLPVIELPSDSDLRFDSRTTPERNQALEPVRHDDTPSPTSAAQLAIPSGGTLAGDTTESPLRARRMEKARTPLMEMRGPEPRPSGVADRLAPIEDAPDAALPAHVRQQLDPAPKQQASDLSASAPDKQGVEPVRGRHAKSEAMASPEFRRVVLGKVEISNHFAVVADPVRQIASEVTRAFETPGVAASADPPPDAVKTISVQLEPESLGAVTLRMRLSGSNLQVRVDVAEPATLDLIQRERDRLQKSMTSDHVSIERLEIRAASGPAPVQGGDGANAPQQDMNAPGQQPRQNSASEGGEPRRDKRSDSRQVKNGQDNDAARGNVSRGVYL